ncbi:MULTISPECIES: hypothetical protein [unclassified Polaromonas]|jgi:hypothetical protein|uniref:hypothetical protein n=1 Tax=unclassified Polaromonas TaxID=2638319 RepID=UPI000BDC1B75|nr:MULTISPECIES: hypothetical protein [unclassified Polaromonas]OYY32331.1 MAG: hypothetical protein B7Y60_22735 [Polaromonas sp. 35-63-35]OYZ15157.1 MAG: hypothetical protein B7Y28_22370 [Polaromonas sp. 16-63-31]OYZ75643.1 MAG: hypothetical protein B7Y09_23510 [Polaromonas sp. 24-63-21]OZA46095.1 MAG: hypothetical protein B7X88_23635 [Polaromonas sp. 17-63-33]OZA85069.1 MAG: hypothetical protein B7X65_23075 [Polaromonas sp. 39-63-25]
MSIRKNKRRISRLRKGNFNPKVWSRSEEEQAWLDIAPVGREFGSPDYERLQILDLYALGTISSDDAMQQLGIGSLDELNQQMRQR